MYDFNTTLCYCPVCIFNAFFYTVVPHNKCLLLWKGDFPSFFCLIYILSYIHYLNHSLVYSKTDLCEPQVYIGSIGQKPILDIRTTSELAQQF